MNNTLASILGLFAALGGLSGIVALLYVRPTYKKLNSEAQKVGAEASEVVAQSAVLLLAPLQTQIVSLQTEVTRLKQTLEQERAASHEERLVTEQTILGLRVEKPWSKYSLKPAQ